MKISEWIKVFTAAYPKPWEYWHEDDIGFAWRPNWTNDRHVSSIGLCVTPPTTKEALDWWKKSGVDMIIAHHPYGRMVAEHVPIIACHTRADRGMMNKTTGEWVGINELWANLLGLHNVVRTQDLYAVGEFDHQITVNEFNRRILAIINTVEKQLDPAWININDLEQTIQSTGQVKRVKICSGAGGMVLGNGTTHSADQFRYDEGAFADTYLTGEVGKVIQHNQFKNVIQTGHTLNERVILNHWKTLIQQVDNVRVIVAPYGVDHWGSDVKFQKMN